MSLKIWGVVGKWGQGVADVLKLIQSFVLFM